MSLLPQRLHGLGWGCGACAVSQGSFKFWRSQLGKVTFIPLPGGKPSLPSASSWTWEGSSRWGGGKGISSASANANVAPPFLALIWPPPCSYPVPLLTLSCSGPACLPMLTYWHSVLSPTLHCWNVAQFEANPFAPLAVKRHPHSLRGDAVVPTWYPTEELGLPEPSLD